MISQRLITLIAAAIPLVSILWAVQLPIYLGLEVAQVQFLAVFLGLAVALVYLTSEAVSLPSRAANGLGALTALLVFGWISFDYQRFQFDFAYLTMEMQIIGAIALVLTIEALRRATGWILLSLVGALAIYALFGNAVPAPLTATNVSLPELAVYLGFDPNAMLGTPLSVVASIVVVFIFFGKLLVRTGCGEFFIDLAMAVMGERRGGAAKIAIVGSALFGSISGSAVSNVVTTGVMTIPLMRRSGYSARQSGAIEAIASTGGQLMPPIMGAAAFLMAQNLEIPYSDVVIAALLPALLYYISVFIQVDLIAGRDDISAVDQIPRPIATVVAEGWHFLVPFAVLLYAMFAYNAPAELAAMYGAIAAIIGGFLRSYRGHRLSITGLIRTLPETGTAIVELTMIVAGAGLVIGLLNISSGSFTLTLSLVQLGSTNFGALLFVSAGICILLGMGMPTSGVYVLLAALVAPSLVEAGIEPLAAHMFILYFGLMSMITPPIALAAFSAATISGDSQMRTGVEAMRLGWVAYVVPFLFVFSPALIMHGDTFDIVVTFLVTIAGIQFISVAIVGYFSRPVGAFVRLLLFATGVLAIVPKSIFDSFTTPAVAAICVGGLLLGWQAFEAKRHRKNNLG